MGSICQRKPFWGYPIFDPQPSANMEPLLNQTIFLNLLFLHESKFHFQSQTSGAYLDVQPT